MFREYAPLRWSAPHSVTGVRVAPVSPPARVTLDSPALSVMTDFSQTPAATIEPESSIEYASGYMRRRGVRTLLVTDADGETVGILTVTDVLGEKPVALALERGVKRQEIRVADIMTPQALLELLAFEEICQARVGHIVATLRQSGRQHFLVGERYSGGERIRGIFSLTQIARQLGANLQPNTFAQTFAEIEAALGH
ncbi:MAG TPA: CBS domain-containing protein [Burkholderiales bacterium]|nr:CBS domain-containing protein [Burkholderiales bacterium]